MAKKKFINPLKVLHIVSELTPIAKAGGLGDITGYLPKELAENFHLDTKIVMPKYKCIDTARWQAKLIIKDLKIKLYKGKYQKISIWKTLVPDSLVPVYLIDAPNIFTSDKVYNHKIRGLSGAFAFFFLSRIALELMKIFDWQPQLIHVHDAMMGMSIKWLKTVYKDDPFYKNTASALTIHNLAHQSIITTSDLKYLDLKKSDTKSIRKFLNTVKINVMAEAIDNADMVNTVSPTYAREVMTKKYGADLDRLLKKNKQKFTGILNGMDYNDFDPKTNLDVPVKYDLKSLNKKVDNKLFLQKKLGLPQDRNIPLICVISRLSVQKGLELVDEVMEDLVDMGAQFVILGSGTDKIEKIFIKAEKDYPKDVAAEIGFDANFAQTIYAGADMLLMPSRFEPCGLSQIIAMRFGTIPIVRKTGGLADTVSDGKTGFVFRHYDKNAFLWAIRRAVHLYYEDKEGWRKMQIRAMKKDFSWKMSAKKYMWLYKKAIKNHRADLESEGNEKA